MSNIIDPIREGLARGWKVYGGTQPDAPDVLECDVAIVGTGAGAGISAELLSGVGLQVVLIEEGPLKSSTDFKQLEAEAYPTLYQDSASRKTSDKAINILQGRCVGGSTTVNWTSSFRTPSATLTYWRDHFELPEMSDEALAPWFAQVEKRLNITPWTAPPNRNNHLLQSGADKLAIPAAVISRNVKACWNLGSCGLGCPTNAKQSMLVTTLPVALDRGARLLVQMRAEHLELDGDKVRAVVCAPVAISGAVTSARRVRVQARHVIVAGGAINSPGLLLRSKVPDPFGLLGRRTFLHPVVASTALFDEPVEGWSGAPQSVYSDHFLDNLPIDGPMGYKLEAPPLHPAIAATTLPGFGLAQSVAMKDFPRTQALLALLRDGFHAQSPGGQVRLKSDGSTSLDYSLNDFLFDAARRAFLSMAEIQFAAGAKSVTPIHEMAVPCTTWRAARALIENLPLKPYLTRVLSAHVMGGCGMAGRADQGVVRPNGRHWQLENLSIHDGSLFPTSIGANPQLSVYGLVNKLATELGFELSGQRAVLA